MYMMSANADSMKLSFWKKYAGCIIYVKHNLSEGKSKGRMCKSVNP